MDPHRLVRPLEPAWQAVVDDVLGGLPARLCTRDVARLAPRLAELSAAYNAGAAEGRRTRLPLEARVAFSLPRDVPKGAAAVRELIASGALAIPADRPLRVLDLGAGLGAMTWGIVRALEASGAKGGVTAWLVDEDRSILAAASAVARALGVRAPSASTDVTVETVVESLADGRALDRVLARIGGPADLVVLGQVLSELDLRVEAPERVERHAALLRSTLARLVARDGSLVIVEPALRDRTRHLHAVRDAVLAPGFEATVFAPCLHAAACPALAVETEWCHEDLAIDLPGWLVPLARGAGLRWQGLTMSYLVLRRDGRRPVAPLVDAGRVRFRAISDQLRSKGKVELFVCGEDGQRRRIRRLDRDEAPARGIPFDRIRRGDVVTLGLQAHGDAPVVPPIDARGRVDPGAEATLAVASIDVARDRQ